MSDMIASGLSWLAGELKSNASETISYTRGLQTLTLQATIATEIFRVTDHLGNTKIERADADFIFSAADLNFGAGPVEPAAGDVITYAIGGVNKQFKLMPQNHGAEPSWRYTDPFQTMLRCHTKYIGNA